MPFKTDSSALDSPFLKRSAKLLPCQKEMIAYWHSHGLASINGIAKMFKVSKRTIQFILFPEREKRNKALRKAKGGSKQYYVKEKHTKAIREHRQYKYETLKTSQL